MFSSIKILNLHARKIILTLTLPKSWETISKEKCKEEAKVMHRAHKSREKMNKIDFAERAPIFWIFRSAFKLTTQKVSHPRSAVAWMIHISWWCAVARAYIHKVPGGNKRFHRNNAQFCCKQPRMHGTARHSLDLYHLLHLVAKRAARWVLMFHEHKTQVHGDEHEWKVFMQMRWARVTTESQEAECKTPGQRRPPPPKFRLRHWLFFFLLVGGCFLPAKVSRPLTNRCGAFWVMAPRRRRRRRC